jgi:hypothetical protein
MAADILKPTFSIKTNGHEFIFRVPTPLDKARQGAREAAIRRAIDPTGAGWADGYDLETFYLVRGMAVLELFLDKSDAKWVYTESSKDKKGASEIAVDITNFPPGTEDVITEVGRQFQAGLDTFHGRGVGPAEPPVSEAVESGESAGAL